MKENGKMNSKLTIILAGFLLVCFSSGVTGESESESNQVKERGGKIDFVRETVEREKVNYWGTGIPVFNGNGTSLNPEQEKTILALMDDFQVNTDSGIAAQLYPAIAMDDSGNFVITWQDMRNGNYDIYAQRYNSAGTSQESNFIVNTDAGTAAQTFPAIAMDGSDNFVITWQDNRNGNNDIYAQRYNSAGTPQGSNFQVNTDAGIAAQLSPDITTNGSGNFVITWQDYRNGIDHLDIYAQRYDSAGTPQDSNFQVNPSTGSWGSYPAVAMDGSGNFVITWEDYRNNNSDVYAKVVTWPAICGDANGDLKVSVSDVVYLINYLFKGGTAPLCPPAPYLACGDASGDGKVTVSDVVYLVGYLFKGGPVPCS